MGVVVPCGGSNNHIQNKDKKMISPKNLKKRAKKFKIPVFDASEENKSAEISEQQNLSNFSKTEDRRIQRNQEEEKFVDDKMGNQQTGADAKIIEEQKPGQISQEADADDRVIMMDSTEQKVQVEDFVVQEKLNKLNEIRAELQKYEWKIKNSTELKNELLAKLALHRWITKIGHQHENFDVFGCAKYRTRAGGIVEELLRALCKLDQIQSEGNEKIRTERKILVELVNNDLLPLADAEYENAKSLVAFNDKVLALIQENNVQKQEQQAEKMVDAEDVPVEAAEPNQPMETVDQKTSNGVEETQSAMEVDEEPKQRRQEADSRSGEDELNFITEELPNAYQVKLVLPQGERFDDIKFNLKSEKELIVSGRKFELPIEVNPSKAVLEEATYRRFGKAHMLITIPKRKRRALDRPTRLGMRQHAPRDVLRESDFYRPLIWGW